MIVSQWLITSIKFNTITDNECTKLKIDKLYSSDFRSEFSQVLPDSWPGDHEGLFILKKF